MGIYIYIYESKRKRIHLLESRGRQAPLLRRSPKDERDNKNDILESYAVINKEDVCM